MWKEKFRGRPEPDATSAIIFVLMTLSDRILATSLPSVAECRYVQCVSQILRRGGGRSWQLSRRYTSYFIFHDVQSQVTKCFTIIIIIWLYSPNRDLASPFWVS
jgi:hypothetical protein